VFSVTVLPTLDCFSLVFELVDCLEELEDDFVSFPSDDLEDFDDEPELVFFSSSDLALELELFELPDFLELLVFDPELDFFLEELPDLPLDDLDELEVADEVDATVDLNSAFSCSFTSYFR